MSNTTLDPVKVMAATLPSMTLRAPELAQRLEAEEAKSAPENQKYWQEGGAHLARQGRKVARSLSSLMLEIMNDGKLWARLIEAAMLAYPKCEFNDIVEGTRSLAGVDKLEWRTVHEVVYFLNEYWVHGTRLVAWWETTGQHLNT